MKVALKTQLIILLTYLVYNFRFLVSFDASLKALGVICRTIFLMVLKSFKWENRWDQKLECLDHAQDLDLKLVSSENYYFSKIENK